MDVTALWNFEDPAGSLERFRQARAETDEPHGSRYATQQARALGLLGRFDEGHAVLDGLSGDDPETVVRTHLERGRLQRSAGVGDRGARAFAKARDLAAQRRDEPPFGGLLVDALHMLALVPDEPTDRVAATQQALRTAEAATDPSAQHWRASLLNNLGCAWHDAGDDESALVAFRQAYILRETGAEHREAQVARYMIGWSLRLLGRFDEARAQLLDLRDDLVADARPTQFVDAELERIERRSTADE